MDDIKFRKIVNKFDKNVKEWSDAINWLQKVKKALEKSTNVYAKEILSKRLAQCLNQNFPSGVHNVTLEVYELIMRILQDRVMKGEEKWGINLALFSPGLFTFYQFAKLDVKAKFHEIIKRYFLGMGSEILPIINGLVPCLLVGLEDQNDEAKKQVEELIAGLGSKVGTRNLFGAIWLAIFRSGKVREASLKYINRTIPTKPEGFNMQKIFLQTSEFLVSNCDELEMGDVVCVEEDRDITLEELIFHFYPKKDTLVLNGLISCLADESIYVQRASLDFLITHMKLTSPILSFSQRVILIQAAALLLLKKNDITIRKFYNWVLDRIKEAESLEQIEVDRDPSLSPMLQAIINILSQPPKEEKAANGPLSIIYGIISEREDNELLKLMLPKLTHKLVDYLYNYGQGYEFSDSLMNNAKGFLEKIIGNYEKSLNLMWSAMGQLLSESLGNNNRKGAIHVIKLIEFFYTNFEGDEENKVFKYIKPIISRLLGCMESLSNNYMNIEFTLEGLTLLGEITHKFKLKVDNPHSIEVQNLYSPSHNRTLWEPIQEFCDFYVKLLNNIMSGNISANTKELDTSLEDIVERVFHMSTKILIIVQKFLDISDELDQPPQWLSSICYCILNYVEKPDIVLICIQGILSIGNKSRKNLNNYQILSKCIGEFYQITSKLWKLQDQTHNDKKVVQLLIKLHQFFPCELSNTIVEELQSRDIPAQVEAINRFAHFWKLSGEYFPEATIFQDEADSLYNMVDFLNNEHPLVRHSAKSWLDQCTPRFIRILDPIIRVLLESIQNAVCGDGKLFLSEIYDTRRVVYAFNKLKSIFQNTKDDMVTRLLGIEISELTDRLYNTDQCRLVFGIMEESKSYLHLLIYLGLKYIVGEGKDHLKEEFYSENAGVNACACEFLEMILNLIGTKSYGPQVVGMIITPLLKALKHSLRDKVNVMQVELLGVIKIILFNCNYISKQYDKNCIDILRHNLFMTIIKLGIMSEVSFVRAYYISFVEGVLGLFSTYLKHPDLTSIVSQLLIVLTQQLGNCYVGPLFKAPKDSKRILITNETDILQIIDGLTSIIHHCFNTSKAQRNVKKEKKSNTFWPFTTSAPTSTLPQFDGKSKTAPMQETCKQILNLFERVIRESLKVWKDAEFICCKEFKLGERGILPFDNNTLNETLQYYHKRKFHKQEIMKGATTFQHSVTNLIEPILINNPNQMIGSILSLWVKKPIRNGTNLKKLIEMLVMMKISTEMVIEAIHKYISSTEYITEINKAAENKQNKLSIKQAQIEAYICQFLYAYLVYCYDWHTSRGDNVKNVWTVALGLFKNLIKSHQPSTICWLLDIMHILSLKFDPRDAYIQDGKSRKSASKMIINLTLLASEIATSKILPTVHLENEYMFDYPINPSIYEMLEKSLSYIEELNKTGVGSNLQSLYMSKTPSLEKQIRLAFPLFEEVLFGVEGGMTIMGAQIEDIRVLGPICMNYLKAFCFSTLRKMLFPLCEKVFGGYKDKMEEILGKVLGTIFPLIKRKDPYYGSYAIDVLHSVLSSKREFFAFRKELTDMFLDDDFFLISPKSLRKWSKIMNWFLQYDENVLLNDLLNNRLTQTGGVFAGKLYEQTMKYRTWKRIAFLIYSGDMDQFDREYYNNFVSKVMEALKTHENPNLLTMIILNLRVMFLKFSKLNEDNREASKGEVAKNLQTLWPNMFSKLIQIFEECIVDAGRNINLVLSALKLLELLSVLNIEDFTISQWIFFIDSFGWKLIKNEAQEVTGEEFEIINKPNSLTFKAYCSKILTSKFTASFLNEEDQSDLHSPGEPLEGQKRRLIFTQNVESLEELTQSIISYTCYLAMRNVNRTYVNMDAVNDLIQKDFVSPEIIM